MPTRLRDLHADVSEAANLISRLRADPTDTAPLGELKNIAGRLTEVFRKIAQAKNAGDLADSIETEEELGLTRFFTEVSSSLVEAQKELDRCSLEYVRQLDPLLQPAYYAIPNLKAEMKVGFSHIGQKGMNLVLFNKSEQKQQYAESSVTFELAATPPPPGPRVLPVLVAGKEREDLLKRLLAHIAQNEDFKRINLGNKVLESPQTQVVLLRYRRQPAGIEGSAYLAVWPAKRQDDPVWGEFLIMGFVDRDEVISVRDDLFENKLKYLRVAKGNRMEPPDPLQLATGMADAAIEMLQIISGWVNPEA